MKTGDKVKIHDGSCNLTIQKGALEQETAIALKRMSTYTVLATNCSLPADDCCLSKAKQSESKKRNDCIIQDNDTGLVVFTCERFLRYAKLHCECCGHII